MDVKELDNRIENLTKSVAELEQKKANEIQGGHNMVGNRAGSLEATVLASFGAKNVKDLMEVNVGHPRFAGVANECKAYVLELKNRVDTARYISQMFHGAALDKIGEIEKQDRIAKIDLENSYYGKNHLAPMIKAFGTTVAGSGLEFVPTLMSSQYIEEYNLAQEIPGLFREIPMPSNPFDMPVASAMNIAQLVAEGGQASATTFTTSKISFSAKKLVQYYEIPEELDEDSAPPFLEIGRRAVVEAQVKAWEQAIIDGDTTGPHQDSDVLSATDARKAWNGLRKLALANSATISFGSAVSKTKLDDMVAAMKKFGVNVRELVWIVGPVAYQQMLSLAEVFTIDKLGPHAVVNSGALASYRGINIQVSQYMREDLNASGVYDGVTTNNTGIILANTTRFMLGMRRPIKTKFMPSLPDFDKMLLASYSRTSFKGHPQSASEKSVVYGIDVSV